MREFGEGVDRICRELEVNGACNPSFHTDEFILKITVRKVTEKVTVKVTENDKKVTDIDYMRGKYLRRVGPDKGGFWEIIKDEEL